MDPPMAHHSTISAKRTAIAQTLKDSGLGLVCHMPTFVSTADLTESLQAGLGNGDAAITWKWRRSWGPGGVLHPSIASGMGVFVLDTVKGFANDFLAEMAAAAQGLNITICLENMFPRYKLGVEPADFEEIFKLFPSLKLTVDTGHAHIDDQEGNRLMALVERFGGRIGHLHFSDNFGKRDDHLAVGKGTVRFAELIRGLKKVGYDDTITLEVFDQDRRMLVESRDIIKAMFAGR